MTTPDALPEGVAAALGRAREAGFALSCEVGVGRLLATLAAGVRPGGRILELGTGAGVGLAWIVKISAGVLTRAGSGSGSATIITWSVGVGL